MLENGLTKAQDQQLGRQLQTAYLEIHGALAAHLQILKDKVQAANRDTVRAAEERAAKASEGLTQAKQFQGKTWRGHEDSEAE